MNRTRTRERVPLAETVMHTGLIVSSLMTISSGALADVARRPPTVPSSNAEGPRRPLTASNSQVSAAASESAALPFDSSDSAGVDAGARSRARALFDQGVRAYGESRYYQAAEFFLSAQRVYPTPQLLFNVAKAYDMLGVQAAALAYYREYLRALPNAQDAADVGKRQRDLEASLAQQGKQQLSVITEPKHALLTLDGVPVGVTPWTGETWPGAHRVTISLDGRKPLATLITVNTLHAQDFTFELEPAASPKAEPSCTSKPASKTSDVSALTWVVLGTATAALATTLVVEMAEKNTSGLTRTGAFFGGIGIATSVLGGVLLHLDLHEPDITPTQKQRAYTASISGRF